MQQVIERLRASKEFEIGRERTMHMAGGYAWASTKANFRQLERVSKIDVEDFATEMAADDEGDRNSLFWTLAEAIYQSADADHFEDLTTLIGTPATYPTVGQTLGFIEGAQQLFAEVRPAI